MMARSAESGAVAVVVEHVRQIGRPCVVCLRVPADRREVEFLLSQPLVSGVVLETEQRELMVTYPGRVGYISPRARDIRLPTATAVDLIYFGQWSEWGPLATWSAMRAGIRRIHVLSGFDRPRVHALIEVAARKLSQSLAQRLWRWVRLVIQSPALVARIEHWLFARRLRRVEAAPLPVTGKPQPWHLGRIVVVGATLGPGGAERQISATLQGLFARGYRDLQFLHHWPMQSPNDFFLPALVQAGIPYSRVDTIGFDSPIPSEWSDDLGHRLAPLGDLGTDIHHYAREFLTRRPEIVHIWLDHMNVVAGLAALLAGVPRIYLGCRSLAPVHFAFNQPYMRPIYRLLARHPSVVFLNNSEAGARDYQHWIGLQATQTRIVRNGLDFSHLPAPDIVTDWRTQYRQRHGIPAGVPVLGTIMRLSEEKRPLLWVEVATRVGQSLPDAHFLVVGNGPMREQTEAAARAGLPGRIHFTGHEANAPMALAAMDLFLLTSRVEGLPNVLIEAQAIGVPPVAIDVGGASETLVDGDTGWLIQSAQASAVVDTVVDLLSDPTRLDEASRRGRDHARSQFSQERMVDETLAVYGLNANGSRSVSK
jgi:glycosyltransferase involved in cell wall biosynthesis